MHPILAFLLIYILVAVFLYWPWIWGYTRAFPPPNETYTEDLAQIDPEYVKSVHREKEDYKKERRWICLLAVAFWSIPFSMVIFFLYVYTLFH